MSLPSRLWKALPLISYNRLRSVNAALIKHPKNLSGLRNQSLLLTHSSPLSTWSALQDKVRAVTPPSRHMASDFHVLTPAGEENKEGAAPAIKHLYFKADMSYDRTYLKKGRTYNPSDWKKKPG